MVSASNARVSDKPISMAFLKFVIKVFSALESAVVKQKGIPAFSMAPAFVGASSQCFMSAKETARASLGSSTSIAVGKFNPII